jgi:hypothetical protein
MTTPHALARLALRFFSVWLACVALISAAQVLGAAAARASFALSLQQDLLGSAEVWCWRTICPAQSTILHAEQALQAFSGTLERRYGNLYWNASREPRWSAAVQVIANPPQVFYVQVTPPDGVYTLGEALVQFGTPRSLHLERDLTSWVIFVCFERGVCVGTLSDRLAITPRLPLTVINFSRSGEFVAPNRRTPGYYAWRGFGRLRR